MPFLDAKNGLKSWKIKHHLIQTSIAQSKGKFATRIQSKMPPPD
jgi:hypothetical protein